MKAIALAVLRQLARAGKISSARAPATARYKLDLPASAALS
jgi:hypothetical protein